MSTQPGHPSRLGAVSTSESQEVTGTPRDTLAQYRSSCQYPASANQYDFFAELLTY